jgi:hypothetical protein
MKKVWQRVTKNNECLRTYRLSFVNYFQQTVMEYSTVSDSGQWSIIMVDSFECTIFKSMSLNSAGIAPEEVKKQDN